MIDLNFFYKDNTIFDISKQNLIFFIKNFFISLQNTNKIPYEYRKEKTNDIV